MGVDRRGLIRQIPAVDHRLRTGGPAGAASRRQHVLGGSRPERRERALGCGPFGRAQFGGEQGAAFLRLLQRRQRREATRRLADRAVEQTGGQRRRNQTADAHRTGRLAEDQNPVRIAPEGRSIGLHPLKRRDLVEQAVVARRTVLGLGAQAGVRQEPEGSEPVVDRDQHHALAGQRRAVEDERRTVADLVAAAVEPDHDRPRTVRAGIRGGPEVEVEAVLAAVDLAAAVDRGVGGDPLPAGGAGLMSAPHALPRFGRLWRAPPQIAHRGRSERDAAEHEHVAGWTPAVIDRGALDSARHGLDDEARAGGVRLSVSATGGSGYDSHDQETIRRPTLHGNSFQPRNQSCNSSRCTSPDSGTGRPARVSNHTQR